MKKVNKILNHDLFIKCLERTREIEKNRIFCKHGIEHFLDVARIARIINGEEGLLIDLEWIYGAALLHDIGRYRQYEDGTPHEQASAELAPSILKECGYDDYETGVIIDAILSHRNVLVAEEKTLSGLLYRADKASRACFCCRCEKECDWDSRKKNKRISY